LSELVDGDDVWVAEAGQGTGFPSEPLGEAWVGRRLGGQDLQGYQAVEGRLARLVHGAHAAFAQEAEDFELWEEPGYLFNSQRHERFGFGAGGSVSSGALLHQAGGAKPCQHSHRQRGTALRTLLWHSPIRSGIIHTPYSEAKPSKCYRKYGLHEAQTPGRRTGAHLSGSNSVKVETGDYLPMPQLGSVLLQPKGKWRLDKA
jgi:hypothetical protein